MLNAYYKYQYIRIDYQVVNYTAEKGLCYSNNKLMMLKCLIENNR